jgi:hypothetical protein
MIEHWRLKAIACLCFLVSAACVVAAQDNMMVVPGASNRPTLFSTEHRYFKNLDFQPPSSLFAVNADGSILYAASSDKSSLLVLDLSSGRLTRRVSLTGEILSISCDSDRSEVYVLMRKPNRIEVLDTSTYRPSRQFDLDGIPVCLTLDRAAKTLYVGLRDNRILAISVSTGKKVGSISDLDDVPRAVLPDISSNRLIVRHQKYISIYSLSDLRFVDYLPLEGTPRRMALDSARGQLLVQLSDEPGTIAAFALRTLEMTGWLNTNTRTYRGHAINVDSFHVNPKDGILYFLDTPTGTFYSKDDTVFQGPTAPDTIPPGVTPSDDIPINPTFDDGNQLVPQTKFDGAGRFHVTWLDQDGNDGSGEGAYFRRFASDQTPLETEFPTPQSTAGDQGSPSLGVSGSGEFLSVWRDGSGKDGSDFGVFGRFYNNTVPASPKTGDVLIPQTTAGRQMMPWADWIGGSNFVVAWSGKVASGNRQTFTRRFQSNGTALEGEVKANTAEHGNTWAVQVDGNTSGEYVTVWRDDADNGIRGRAYNADGSPVTSSMFQAGPYVAGNTATFAPSVGIFADGSFLVVWKENQGGGIVGERFTKNQVSQGRFVVTSKKTKSQDAPIISVDANDRYIVVWRDSGYSTDEIVARWFDSDGTPLSDDFVVPQDPAGDEFEPNIAMDSAGNFFACWKDRGRTPTIYGRYFSVGPPPVPITITGLSPSLADRGTSLTFTVYGSGFDGTTTVSFNDPGITVDSYGTITEGTIEVNATFTASAFLGYHDVTVTREASSATAHNFLQVLESGAYPAPVVTSITPSSGDQSKSYTVDIGGSDFANHPSTTVDFGADITVSNVTFVSNILIRADITIQSGAAVGPRSVMVSNPGPQTGACTDCFTVIFNPVLFSDDFEDLNYDGWTTIDGTWTAAGAALEGTRVPGKTWAIATVFSGCTVCSVEADIRVGTGDYVKVSLVGWYLDKKNYVELMMDKTKDKWKLKVHSGGTVIARAKYLDPEDISSNVRYHAKILYDGVNLQVFVRGGADPVITLPTTVSEGTVGFNVKSTSGTIDDVVVNPSTL